MTKIEEWGKKIAPCVVKALEKHNFLAYYCPTKKEAKDKVLSLINKNDTVSFGGSVTLEECGILDAIREGGYNLIDRDSVNTMEEKIELTRKALLADTYLSGTNALTLDGTLFNIDGNGNRVAAITYGPKSVIIVCGINKIVRDIDAAVDRVRNFAAPINAGRFEIDTPCKKTGVCANCNSDDCICNVFTLTRHSKPQCRIKVIIVGEVLGF